MHNCFDSSLVRRSQMLIIAAAFAGLNASAQHYTQTNLASGTANAAPVTDSHLSNPWGLSRSSGGPWWVADAGSGLSTLYDGTGAVIPLVVTIPGGTPIATIFNGTGGFALAGGKSPLFLFASSSGIISGWASGDSAATVLVSNPGSDYRGLAIASMGGQNYLYAADFKNGRIDVFDTNMQLLRYTRPGVTDNWFTNYPGSGSGFTPYNMQNIGNTLYITFAQRDPRNGFEVRGAGMGFVASYTPDGKLVRSFATGSWLNVPWGIALAPCDFGAFSHDLLVGQFGSGQIVAYNISTGNMDGMFLDASGNPISIPGLWALSFGGGNSKSGPANSLYFTALGQNLFGTLTAEATDQVLGNGN